jgi:hypothetical protein
MGCLLFSISLSYYGGPESFLRKLFNDGKEVKEILKLDCWFNNVPVEYGYALDEVTPAYVGKNGIGISHAPIF